MASQRATQAFKKYTVQPTGIYARINALFSIDPKRSTGVPLNPQFRNPPPGANDPATYDDPVTFPAADLADNPYWKRDVRRRYPRLSTVTQGDVVGLLEVGSKAVPRGELIGVEGGKKLVEVKREGEKGLSAFLEKEGNRAVVTSSVLGPGGMPPLPSGMHNGGVDGKKRYELLGEQSYTGHPCRTFE
ncbi:21 kDa subunit of NADH dehydrogenase [Lepidopterella palustris CBS 459.81]|uniref:21 kDa subunit of NADH dehydrogenase n=1 Tax=Lepidopterella palustris CBS 459.81 TaxID=1314670 RepID=A0A8E2JAC2_9PEZI|nr:21 kDa subunit of NADH dehydrogenase [Lepidopterella palustris CBS 459.81]